MKINEPQRKRAEECCLNQSKECILTKRLFLKETKTEIKMSLSNLARKKNQKQPKLHH